MSDKIMYNTIHTILADLKRKLSMDRDEVVKGQYTFEKTPEFPSNPFHNSGRLEINSIDDTIVVDEKLTFYTPNSYGITLETAFQDETQIGLLVGQIGGEKINKPQKYYHLFVMPDGKTYFRTGTFDGTNAIWTSLYESNILTDIEKDVLSNTSGTNTGDQDLSHLATKLELESEVNDLESQIQALASGSPKGSFPTLVDLETEYPTGAEGIYVITATGHWYYWNNVGEEWVDGGLYQAALDVVGELGESETKVVNQKAVTDELALKADQTELDQLAGDVIQKTSTLIGDNLFNPNYLPVGEQLWMKGGDGTLITTNSIVANSSFYTSSIIQWANANKMIVKRIRSYVQLDGLFNPIAFYYPSSGQRDYVITKEVNAKYIKICCDISDKPTNIVNYGETLILYRPYRENKVYNSFSNTEITDREIIDIKNKIKTFDNTVTGNNLFNPYYSPISDEEWAKGGINTLINDLGVTVSSSGWYTTSLVEWKENSTMFAKRYRSWAQLNEYMDVIAVDYPPGVVNNQQIAKAEGAKYIKISVPWSYMSNLKLEMLNYGSVALAYEEYHEKSINTYTGYDYTADYYLRLREYIINESFTVPSATYDANGVIVSPLNVLWADGGTGQLTITRNSNFSITKILATYLKNDVSINMTLNINRDINDNVTSVTF